MRLPDVLPKLCRGGWLCRGREQLLRGLRQMGITLEHSTATIRCGVHAALKAPRNLMASSVMVTERQREREREREKFIDKKMFC